jgi:monoamine oxidase
MYFAPTTAPLSQPSLDNPTDSQRHRILYDSLVEAGRPEDCENIVEFMSPLPDITKNAAPGRFKNIKVGIIGGGLSGMCAAFELRKLGFDITIFEPTTFRIGGRVYTYYFDREKRFYGELGAMRIPVSHETTWHYINLFKLSTTAFGQYDPNTFTYVRDTRVRNDPGGENITGLIFPKFDLTAQERNTPWPQLRNNAVNYYFSTLPTEIRKQIIMILPEYDYRLVRLESISSRRAYNRYGLSDEAINLIASVSPLEGELINQSFEMTLNEEYTIDFTNLYRIRGGLVNLPLAFYNSLISKQPSEYGSIAQEDLGNVTWKGGFSVTGIFKSQRDEKVTLRYRHEAETQYRYEDFDYVICALPFPPLRGMDIFPKFSGRKMQAIREVYYEDAQKTLFLCSERFWEKQGIRGGISDTDEIIQTTHYPPPPEKSGQNPANTYNDASGVLLASYNMDEDAYALGNMEPRTRFFIIRNKLALLHGLSREYLNSIILKSKSIDWISEPHFYGAFQMFLPGQKSDFLYVSSTPEYDNRVFFAGEHTSTKNGWIQGALQSGMRAANSLAYYSSIHHS